MQSRIRRLERWHTINTVLTIPFPQKSCTGLELYRIVVLIHWCLCVLCGQVLWTFFMSALVGYSLYQRRRQWCCPGCFLFTIARKRLSCCIDHIIIFTAAVSSPSAGSSQLLNIQSQNSNFLTSHSCVLCDSRQWYAQLESHLLYQSDPSLTLWWEERKWKVHTGWDSEKNTLAPPPCIFFSFFVRSYNFLNERLLMSCLLLLLWPPFH